MTRSSPAAIVPDAIPDLCLAEARIWRVWNALLGEKDNFAADREVAARLLRLSPQIGDLASTSHSFSQHVCEYLAMQEIDQFIDCNPRMTNPTHDTVQRVNKNARVLYVSGDPIELAHAQALLNPDHRTHVVAANIFNVKELYVRTDAAEYLDWSRPIALLLTGPLPLAPGTAANAAAIMKAHVDQLCPGSYTAVTHWLQPSTAAKRRTASLIEDELVSEFGAGRFRTRNEIKALFPDQVLVDPGLVQCDDWPMKTDGHKRNWVEKSSVGALGRKV
ncbi:SAM-dependent methyltransferase [Kribbella sp. CA-294648]|uniref:SAM-dependent methyltransferase n=1 Tax=Kribbella sp. CA-294648 TaxID=3239948 RepID=UPI003D918A4B